MLFALKIIVFARCLLQGLARHCHMYNPRDCQRKGGKIKFYGPIICTCEFPRYRKPTPRPHRKPPPRPHRKPPPRPHRKPPTPRPTVQTPRPTEKPSSIPTASPTNLPTQSPSYQPTDQPTAAPTSQPTSKPTIFPTPEPSKIPTDNPTSKPTQKPSSNPTVRPTDHSTLSPTFANSLPPSKTPTNKLTVTNGAPCEDLPICTTLPGICNIVYLSYLCPFKCGECNTNYPTIMPTTSPTVECVEDVNHLNDFVNQLKKTIVFLVNLHCDICEG